ncbi:hypothetical protein MF271_19480 (plasmid) [Deinococcus sp. KNUC1210]|uniref:hypothetical protein n=1 Tax=Deinococcus sp. KNUC1210 TaxID=2917691 RepID=UPI001EF06201|nr:hypothetical protein [Deinococcus sp. KNUC1210]ULH17374.1 hypothetical protein MF271_19480 [Deinococcus sp. KNUC1210]
MIVVKIEVHPNGQAHCAREIERVTIRNIGGTEEHGDYLIGLGPPEHPQHVTATLRHWPRTRRVASLIHRALVTLLPDLLEEP